MMEKLVTTIKFAAINLDFFCELINIQTQNNNNLTSASSCRRIYAMWMQQVTLAKVQMWALLDKDSIYLRSSKFKLETEKERNRDKDESSKTQGVSMSCRRSKLRTRCQAFPESKRHSRHCWICVISLTVLQKKWTNHSVQSNHATELIFKNNNNNNSLLLHTVRA